MAFLSKPNNAWVAYLRLRMVKEAEQFSSSIDDEIGAHSLLFQRVRAVLVACVTIRFVAIRSDGGEGEARSGCVVNSVRANGNGSKS